MGQRIPMHLAGGAWEIIVFVEVHTDFVHYDRYRMMVVLTRDFAAWLAHNDPKCSVEHTRDRTIVRFSNENAAMMFRLAHDVDVFRFGG